MSGRARTNPPYLSIHDDDGCGGFPSWSAELAEADLQRAFLAGGFRGTLRDIQILSRNDSGRVATLALDGLTPREISGQDLRMVVGRTLGFQHIQSTQFELRRAGRAFRFTGRGAGHGVGLCVIGSMKLAAKGQSATSILARYFPGTQIGALRRQTHGGTEGSAERCRAAPRRTNGRTAGHRRRPSLCLRRSLRRRRSLHLQPRTCRPARYRRRRSARRGGRAQRVDCAGWDRNATRSHGRSNSIRRQFACGFTRAPTRTNARLDSRGSRSRS